MPKRAARPNQQTDGNSTTSRRKKQVLKDASPSTRLGAQVADMSLSHGNPPFSMDEDQPATPAPPAMVTPPKPKRKKATTIMLAPSGSGKTIATRKMFKPPATVNGGPSNLVDLTQSQSELKMPPHWGVSGGPLMDDSGALRNAAFTGSITAIKEAFDPKGQAYVRIWDSLIEDHAIDGLCLNGESTSGRLPAKFYSRSETGLFEYSSTRLSLSVTNHHAVLCPYPWESFHTPGMIKAGAEHFGTEGNMWLHISVDAELPPMSQGDLFKTGNGLSGRFEALSDDPILLVYSSQFLTKVLVTVTPPKGGRSARLREAVHAQQSAQFCGIHGSTYQINFMPVVIDGVQVLSGTVLCC